MLAVSPSVTLLKDSVIALKQLLVTGTRPPIFEECAFSVPELAAALERRIVCMEIPAF
jgi:hypothetical protein